jgi:hypothetical protein
MNPKKQGFRLKIRVAMAGYAAKTKALPWGEGLVKEA